MSNKELIQDINKDLENKSTLEVIEYFLTKFKNVALSSSLAAEDQVLTDIMLKQDKNATIFTLETPRSPKATVRPLSVTERGWIGCV